MDVKRKRTNKVTERERERVTRQGKESNEGRRETEKRAQRRGRETGLTAPEERGG